MLENRVGEKTHIDGRVSQSKWKQRKYFRVTDDRDHADDRDDKASKADGNAISEVVKERSYKEEWNYGHALRKNICDVDLD